MAITVAQIPEALNTVGELTSVLNDIRMLLDQARELSAKNWQINIASRGSLMVTISAEQRLAMLAQYEDYKAQLVTAFQNLP